MLRHPLPLFSVRRASLGLLLTLAMLLTTVAHAALGVRNVSEALTPEDLVNRLLGGGVTAFNVQFTGTTNAAGLFCSGLDAVGIEVGVMLSSGDISIVLPPNNSSGAGQDNKQPGDADLTALIPGFETFDAAVLEFDFIPEADTVQFKYVFGSEEYNEFVDTPFNDVFGFFVNGVNFALIPGTTTAVSINNVNNGHSDGASAGPCRNCQFYIDNVGTNGTRNTQLDGMTTELTFTAPVQAGQTNHLKIAIADAGDHILDSDVFIEAGSLRSIAGTNCVTRDARFWFTHPFSDDPRCATLERALATAINTGCEGFDLGFLTIPQGYRNDDNVRDETDAMIEALGFYYRSDKKTGDLGGTQNQAIESSPLCRERKRLAVELIAAVANTFLFATDPGFCTFTDGGVSTNFPSDLIVQARQAMAGYDIQEIQTFRVLLAKFNSSGVTNTELPPDVVECSADLSRKVLKSLSRDPSTQFNCPGENDLCETAEVIAFPNANDPFAPAIFKTKVNLTKFKDNFESPSCAGGGPDAVWRIPIETGKTGRRFTADTLGSNFDTVLTIFQGTTCSNATAIACNDDFARTLPDGAVATVSQSQVSFTTDGTNDVFVVIDGKSGAAGKAKLRVTSP